MKLKHNFKKDEVKDEIRIWTQLAKPNLESLSENVISICEYGFTEILNNVIDHSDGENIIITGEQDSALTSFSIEDDGVGVFEKLRNYFDYDNDVHALIELVKGKLTVAPEKHSGEGLFFSSKVFDKFSIYSGDLLVTFENNQCLVEHVETRVGTLIKMEISNESKTEIKDVFDKFCDLDYAFSKTVFFISLATLEGSLISRSQAKRVTTRFEKFKEVELSFSGVKNIGQGFADELFRVWMLNNPDTELKITNANDSVKGMVKHIQSRKDLPQPPIDKIKIIYRVDETGLKNKLSSRHSEGDFTSKP